VVSENIIKGVPSDLLCLSSDSIESIRPFSRKVTGFLNEDDCQEIAPDVTHCFREPQKITKTVTSFLKVPIFTKERVCMIYVSPESNDCLEYQDIISKRPTWYFVKEVEQSADGFEIVFSKRTMHLQKCSEVR